MKYIYNDRAGNKYEIQSLSLVYTPIKPAESSSGTYDGGEAYTKVLTKLDFIKFVDVFERAIWSQSDHFSTKEIGCSTVRKYLEGEIISQVYLKSKSSSCTEIFDMLKSFQRKSHSK